MIYIYIYVFNYIGFYAFPIVQTHYYTKKQFVLVGGFAVSISEARCTRRLD